MSSDITENFIMDILKECFPQASDIQFTDNLRTELNQNYTSDIKYLFVKYRKNNENHQIELAIKMPRQRHQSQFYEKLNFFNKEALVYDKMLPLVHQLLDSPLAPLHYHTTDSKILVVEDLSAQGYESRDQRNSLNLQQSYPILKTISYFHAATHKIHQSHPDLLSEPMFQRSAYIEVRRNIASAWEPILCDLLKMKNASNLIPKFAKAVSFINQDDDVILSKIHQSNFDFVVLNHGDCRVSNVLFKYGTNELIESTKLIDFQTCNWSSPVADVIYFITTSVHIDTVQEHFDTLVDSYLQCLNEKLQEFECSTVYTKDLFMKDFQKLKWLMVQSSMSVSSIMCPLDRAQLEAIFMKDKKERTSSYDLCLKDEQLGRISYGWLMFCDRIGAFDGLENL